MASIISTNPGDEYNILGSVTVTRESDIIEKITKAKKAHSIWSKMPLSERVSMLRTIYTRFVEQKELLAESVAHEMGMPIRLARDEVQYGLNYFLWYLDNAEKYLSPEIVFENESEIHTVFYESKGVVAAITPWNYPVMLFVWACIQPLLAGNVVIWKISKEVILTGVLIERIMQSGNLPEGVWSEVYGDGAIGDILTDGDIDGITFTGSTSVGKNLAKKAYEKGIPALMELGGSAPGIVTEDADIESVLETIYFMRFSNSGQMCDGLKRLIVHESRYAECIEKLRTKLYSKKIGNPLREDTDIGPLVSARQLENITSQLEDALQKGAIILAQHEGDNILHGAYMPAYILGGITRDMRVWKEEVFGPVLPVVTFKTEEEAIELANDTEYGLGAYIFTQSREVFDAMSSLIKSGMVQMNNVNYCIPSDPFGGYKSSGIGREHGKWGYHEFVNIKVTSTPKNN